MLVSSGQSGNFADANWTYVFANAFAVRRHEADLILQVTALPPLLNREVSHVDQLHQGYVHHLQ